ncbi:MAG: VPLPA-CTERM sorting domain-containing protein, partial [Boseongicola sp.]|nr:VPLPA-CTERM sorting domain-containing protein [Boseongicola sp.]
NMAGDFVIDHDDGIAVGDDGVRIGRNDGPTVERTTKVFGFDGGEFSLLYVATNGDPSVLRVNGDLAPIPLPATLPLLLVGMGGLAMMRRKHV